MDYAGGQFSLHTCLAQVSALVDTSGTGTNVTVVPVLTNRTAPAGLAWHDNSLYVAEHQKLTRYDDPDAYALAGQVGTLRDVI